MEETPQEPPANPHSALTDPADVITCPDPAQLETLLANQVQVLNRIFMDAVQKYAEQQGTDGCRIHGAIALKSQNYCRMTIAAINQLKDNDTAMQKIKKSRNELLRRTPHYAPVDTGRTATPVGPDPWLAAMEEELWGNNP